MNLIKRMYRNHFTWFGLIVGHLLTVIMFMNAMLEHCNMDGGCANLDWYLYVLAPFLNFPGYPLMIGGALIGYFVGTKIFRR